jgi:S-formylglutathione hydrolase
MSLQRRSDQACFGGRISIYSHASEAIKSEMRFAIYLPPQAARTKVPALYYLA